MLASIGLSYEQKKTQTLQYLVSQKYLFVIIINTIKSYISSIQILALLQNHLAYKLLNILFTSIIYSYILLRKSIMAQPLSQHNQNIFDQLQRIVVYYPIEIQKIEALLLQLNTDGESDASIITSKTETMFNNLLMTILNVEVDKNHPDWEKMCGLPQQRLVVLKKLLQAVCGGPASQKFKRSVVISFIQNVLECLGVSDMTEILDLISTQIPRFANALQQSDQLKLLRVINLLLKRVSKTQDYHLRGQLHLALTRFLPFCHDSGFHFRAAPAKANEWERIDQGVEEIQETTPGLTYEFYQQFWRLQKWFMQANQIVGQVMSNRLKKIEKTLEHLLNYFSVNPAKQKSDYYAQPLKFLKNYNLLGLQLGDPFFRKVIMLQAIFFIHAIYHPYSKVPIPISQNDKKILAQIQAITKKFFNQRGQEGKKLLEEFQTILNGQKYWIGFKENWKDKKKNFFKKAEQPEEEAKKKEESRQLTKEIERRRSQIKKTINDKLKINTTNLQRFLEDKELISLESGPTYPSFSHYVSQAKSCLQSFDRQNGKQTQFQTRAQYNMFEWKAMRSLYRENLKDIWSTNDKAAGKMKEYRLISLMNRKQEEFTDPQPTKKVKEN